MFFSFDRFNGVFFLHFLSVVNFFILLIFWAEIVVFEHFNFFGLLFGKSDYVVDNFLLDHFSLVTLVCFIGGQNLIVGILLIFLFDNGCKVDFCWAWVILRAFTFTFIIFLKLNFLWFFIIISDGCITLFSIWIIINDLGILFVHDEDCQPVGRIH